ncbi:MAG TPA: type II toxin-antitoxin system prevent-host-death family antitoxin [Rhizomicrobium sp.]|jgi:prevent-host-death family protein|nr:type II toxin-antitoxin system prevent-host-death family antitoxin [Rhizomicrobium sp.]
MSQHSVAETKNQLSDLIDRAEKGEEIIITRHGHPVARISGIESKPEPNRITQDDIDWLDAHRVGSVVPEEDAGALVSRMRDEEWDR